MALEGSVKDFSVVDIFQLIAMQKKSGILTLSYEEKAIFVSFVDGEIVRAVEGDENERFTNALVASERITIIQLRAASRVVEKDVSMGETFAKLAYLTTEEVQKWNQVLTQETIFDLLSWEAGSYRFEQKELSINPNYYLPLSVERLLMEGMRQSDEWPALLKKIPSPNLVFEIIGGADPTEPGSETEDGDHLTSVTGPRLEPDEHAWLLQWIDGQKTVDGIIKHAGVGSFPVYKGLTILLSNGRLRKKEIKDEEEKTETKSSFLSTVSLDSLKEKLSSPALLNSALVSLSVVILMTFFIPSFYGIPSILQKVNLSMTEFKKLSSVARKERITFSLDLYRLRHNRYPSTLSALVADGLLSEGFGQELSDTEWTYISDGKTFSLSLKSD